MVINVTRTVMGWTWCLLLSFTVWKGESLKDKNIKEEMETIIIWEPGMGWKAKKATSGARGPLTHRECQEHRP